MGETVTAAGGQAVRPQHRDVAAVGGLVAFLLLAVGALWWAKWAPYAGKVSALSASHAWSGTSLLAAAGVRQGSGPSLSAGLHFTQAYWLAVWHALVAALLISAAVQTLVPRTLLKTLLTRRTRAGSAVVGGVLGLPSMMCSCCSAPVASALRRSGAPTAGVVAYWLGNPLLDPAVLVFLALVAPWQWVATRFVVGALLVVGGAALVGCLTDRRLTDGEVDVALAAAPRPADEGPVVTRFLAALLRTTVVLVPEYLLVVLLVGTFSGWLFPLAGDARSWGVLAALVAVVLGTLLVIPTGGEIPLTEGLALAGFGGGVVGALLITLPAISLPSVAMVSRALTWRVTLATAGVVALGGVVAAALLPALLSA